MSSVGRDIQISERYITLYNVHRWVCEGGLISNASCIVTIFKFPKRFSFAEHLIANSVSSASAKSRPCNVFSLLLIMASSDVRFKQRAVTEFIVAENVKHVVNHRRLLSVYDNETLDIRSVHR